MKIKRFIQSGIILFLYFHSFMSLAQLQPPPSLRWYKISTPGYRVFFPKGLENEALKAASLMDYITEIVPGFYDKPRKPVSLYLHNQTVTANGYVALAPRHMAWFIHASQDVDMLGSSDWLNTLALHEYRHVVQFDYLNRNLTLFLTTLFGEAGLSFASLWAVPMWYYEGDAISSETLFGRQGRGRLPAFEMEMKATFAGSGNRYTYNQAYLRSYRRHIPNHYYLGYYMHTHVSNNYGVEKWPLVMERVTKNPFSPYSFSTGLKKVTGANLKNTYKNTFNDLIPRWEESYKPLPANIQPLPFKKSKVYTNYRYGHFLEDSTLVSLKFGMADAPSLVLINNQGKEKVLRGLNNSDFISSNGRLIAWCTVERDARYGMRDFSDIMLYDHEYGTIKRLTYKSKYVSPAVSPSGKMIAAVYYNPDRTYRLDILNASDGSLVKSFSFEGYIRTPSWSHDEKQLVFTLASDNLISLVTLNLETGEENKVISATDENISKPVFRNDFILFVSSARGNNEVHAINPANNKRYIALAGGYGFFNPSQTDNTDEIVIESYTPDGYRLYSWVPDFSEFEVFEKPVKTNHFINPTVEKGNYSDIFKDFVPANKDFKIKRYNLFTDGLKLHSWAILPSNHGVQGIVYINDPLSVAGFTAGIHYNQNEQNTFQYLGFNYSGFFPIVSVQLANGNRTLFRDESDNATVNFYQWAENSLSADIFVPLNISFEAMVSNVEFSGGYDYIFIRNMDEQYKDIFDIGNGSFGSLNAGFSFIAYKQKALRDIYPSTGISLNAGYYRTLPASDYKGSLLSLSGTLFLKGLLKHHSLRLQMAYESQDPGETGDAGYIYSSEVLFYRGYENIFTNRITKISADYSLPLAYPDLGLGSVLYIKRIRANLFTDMGKGESSNFSREYFSFGADLIFDVNFFRFLPEIDLGIGAVYAKNEGTTVRFVAFQRFGY
ncbi:MAG: hypothetical protein JXB00_19465 [Bacteroidales bacterium]|nr:hypothetical protein [Bacteroidales bacterium]